MSRFVDYFVVVGYDHEKERAGKILQRFPEYDWPETPFHQGIEMFCQPQGWKVHQSPKVPEFFVSVLTDIDAYRHYCACLTFTEAFVPTTTSQEEDEGEAAASPQVMYAPKSICLVSRHEYFETFRQCLGIIYAVYVDRLQYRMEVLVGNLLGFIQVPPPGGPQVRFSIGADDRQSVQPPLSSSVPISRDSVAIFCQELGISNVLLLLCAALTDAKIMFYSSSYSRLIHASHAITSLCYPLKYSYVYVPVLPSPLLEVLNSPTPFIMGIHTSLKDQVLDLLDVIFVDLDGCKVEVPESVSVSLAPEPIYSHAVAALKMVLDPSLLICDHAFPSQNTSSSRSLPEMLDKELRAVFIQFFCEVFAGYRSCLTVVRIHPEPVITFQKAQFLGQRNLVGDDFVSKVIGSMSFGRYIQEYASPFRTQTVFDEIYSEYQLLPFPPDEDGKAQLQRTREIANRLYLNENPLSQPYAQKCLRPDSLLAKPVVGYTFPWIDMKMVDDIIQDGTSKASQVNKWQNLRVPPSVVIPVGLMGLGNSNQTVITNSAKRLEVLSNCVNLIFENRINDAKKLLPAVIRVLSNPSARLALSREFGMRVQSNRAMLEHQQFELVVKLINCALQDDSVLDEYGVAAAFLPLVTAFCRKLCTGVIQFAYTKIQDHDIWSSMSFWESAFYKDVQQHISALYWPSLLTSGPPVTRPVEQNGINGHEYDDQRKNAEELQAFSTSITAPTALDITANQLRSWASYTPVQQKETIDREESTVFSQAIHYANRIVYLKVPLDVNSSRLRRRNSLGTDTNSNSNFTNSFPESDNGSVSEESGFQEEERASRDMSSTVSKFVTKFVDKVCGESNVSEDHIKQLHQMIPGVVAMHIESLEAVYRESKHLQPILKPKITKPPLLAGEDMVMEGLRAHLLVDGRDEGTGGIHGGPSLLPCEGALFLTTYRVIFMGSPVDTYVSDYIVLRSFPVAALTKEKRLTGQYIKQVDQFSQECFQLRSSTFQLIRVGFDDEVTGEVIDQFRKLLERMRYPLHIMEILNQSSAAHSAAFTAAKNGKKVGSIKGFAKKTLLRTVKAAGIKTKSQKKENGRFHYNPSATPLPERKNQLTMPPDRNKSAFEEEGSDDDSDTLGPTMRETQTFERVIDRSYVKDFRRTGLIPNLSSVSKRVDEYRLCQVNLHYKVCPSYPALIVVPNNVSDDTVRNLARHFKEMRFPSVVWQHPRTRAVLVRSGSYHNARMSSVFKSSNMSTAGSLMTIPAAGGHHEAPASSQAEFEKYLSALVHNMPVSVTRRPSTSSIMNLNNFAATNGTPDSIRRLSVTPWQRTVQTLRTSSGKNGGVKRASVLFPNDKGGSLVYANNSELSVYGCGGDTSSEADRSSISHGIAPHTSLFVLGDKAPIKAIRLESHRCDFVPLDYPDVRRVKAGFKKLLQAVVPSAKDAPDAPQGSYLRQIENLDWLKQIHRLLKVAGTVVDILDAQGSSVLLSLEDGWDATCQISALAQLFLDPYYRTIEGFSVLVEKEFAAFGHRFGYRNNVTQASQTNGVAPVFVQFLDCVSQVQRQFPMSFEFNPYFLKFLAFHSASNRFTNFITDSEAERVDVGLLENRRNHPAYESDISHWPVNCGSIWEYIECVNRKAPRFYNFTYATPLPEDEQVLRAFLNWPNIVLWDYYIDESLAFGSLYDLELIDPEVGPEHMDGLSKTGRRRRVVSAGYNNPSHALLNSFDNLFEEIRQLESDLGYAEEEWQEHWQRLDQDSQLIVPLQKPTPCSQMIRSHSRRLQTQITMEILEKSKSGENSSQTLGHPHRFVHETYTTPTHCNFCSQILWGNGKLAVVCADCGYRAHQKCVEQIPNSCTKVKVALAEGNDAIMSKHILVGRDTLSVSPLTPMKSHYLDGPSMSENRVLEGYLFKRGAVLNRWKQKWFVLDSMHHQLRYYESNQDPQVRGTIDLSEVMSVCPTSASIILQGAPKRFNDKACFDVRTLRRSYNLSAKDPAAAQEWIEKIQLYLQ